MVSQAVQRGLKYVYSARKEGGTWETQYDRRYAHGVEALVLLTALEAGESLQQPALAAALKQLSAEEVQATYARAMRIMVYARLGEKYADALKADVAALARLQQPNGGWGYGPDHPTTKMRQDWSDASNSQMALMALADAAAAGAPAKPELWTRARDYWEKSQNPDGGWGYESPGKAVIRLRGASHGSMTAAGLASYVLATAQLASGGDDKKPASLAPILKAVDYLTKNYSLTGIPGWVWGKNEEYLYFYHWHLARAAGLCGIRMFGTHDWYPEAAALLLTRQRADGGWSEPYLYGTAEEKSDVVRTCFVLLALLRGSASPVLARLNAPGVDLTNILDASNFASWLSASRKQPFGWVSIDPAAPPAHWADVPVVYIPATDKTEFISLPGPALHDFLMNGGSVLVSATDRATASAAQAFFTTLLKKQDPQAGPLPPTHPLWNVLYKIEDKPAGVLGVGDATRLRVLIVPGGLAEAWHTQDAKKQNLFELAANLAWYSTDMAPPTRLAGRKAAPPKRPAPVKTVVVARVKHAGGWAAGPKALPRLGDVLADALSFGLSEADPVDLSDDVPPGVGVLWMTGTGDPDLSADKLARLKNFLTAGGTVFVDSTIGAKAFGEAVDAALKTAFAASYKDLPATHAILTGEIGGGAGADVREVRLAGEAGKGGPKPLRLQGVEVNGRVGLVFSRLGVTSGLDGSPVYGALSLAGDDARRLAANVILYALMGE